MNLNKIAAYIVITLALVSAGLWWHDKQVKEYQRQVQVELAAQYNGRLITLQNKADELGFVLDDKIKEATNVKNAQIDALNARIGVLTASLSNRPSRSDTSSSNGTNNSGNSESPKGATGVQLYREDAVAFARYSQDTAELQTHLIACYRQYDEVKAIMDKYRRDNAIPN